MGSNGESSLLGGRFAAALRQLLKPKPCLIRMDIGFRRCLVLRVAPILSNPHVDDERYVEQRGVLHPVPHDLGHVT